MKWQVNKITMLIKVQVDEITNWWNDKLIKC